MKRSLISEISSLPRFQTKQLSLKTSSMVEITIILCCINMNSCRTTTKNLESAVFTCKIICHFASKLLKMYSRLKVLPLALLLEKLVQCFFLWTWRVLFPLTFFQSSCLLLFPSLPTIQPWRCWTAISIWISSCSHGTSYWPDTLLMQPMIS